MVMTIARLITAGGRAAIMILAGAALIALPFALALSAAAVLLGTIAGALAVGLGISGTAGHGRGTLPVSVQAAYDRLLALSLLIAAIAFGSADQDVALTVFGLAGVATLLVSLTTRYSFAPST
jgi:hypothetical protein